MRQDKEGAFPIYPDVLHSCFFLGLGKGLAAAPLPGFFRKVPMDALMATFSVCSVPHLCSGTQRLRGMPAEQVIPCPEGSPSMDRASSASQGCISHPPRPPQHQAGPTGCSAPAQGRGTDTSHIAQATHMAGLHLGPAVEGFPGYPNHQSPASYVWQCILFLCPSVLLAELAARHDGCVSHTKKVKDGSFGR